jgi:plastocyanin
VGGKLTWTNRDSAPHSATDTGGTWDTGVLAKDESATLTFASAGTFDYFCSLHPDMKARLVVQ